MKDRIVVLSGFYPPSIGGMEKQLMLIGRVLADEGVRVNVHTSAMFAPKGVSTKAGGFLTLHRDGQDLRRWSDAAVGWIRKHYDSQTILLITSLGPDTTASMRRILEWTRRLGGRTIMRLPTSDHLFRARQYSGAQECIRMIDRFITNSARASSEMQSQYDVVYVPSCLAPSERIPIHEPFPERHSVAYFGRLSERKRLEILPEIAAHLPKSVDLLVQGPAGFGETTFAMRLKKLLRSAGVKVFPAAHHPSVEVVNSVIYVNPSATEGCSSALLEAMNRGSIPVVSNLPENESVLGGLGRLCEHDPKKYAEAVIETINDSARPTMQRQLRQRVASRFSMESIRRVVCRAILEGW